MKMSNIFDNLTYKKNGEIVTGIVNSGCRIERITSCEYASPAGFWYEQREDEWALLLQGRAEIGFENGYVSLRDGDCVGIEKMRRHKVLSTSADCVWLCVRFSR
jgi:cupin 2 domain-containing protein